MADDDFDFDLSAWESPAPPAGIADGVVERLREAVAASPMTHLTQTAPSRSSITTRMLFCVRPLWVV